MNNYCIDNVNKIVSRVEKDFKSLKIGIKLEELFNKNGKYIFIATGSTYIVSLFWSKIVNIEYKCFTKAMLPRDFIYSNYDNVDKIIVFSYSGLTKDILEAIRKVSKEKLLIVTKGDIKLVKASYNVKKDNIISFYSTDIENGFINFEASIFPCMLLLNSIVNDVNIKLLKRLIDKWNNYFDKLFSNNDLKNFFKSNINIFYGDMATVGAFDIENKLIESGICNCILHEKKNFSHGRYVLFENRVNNNIYFKEKDVSKYESALLEYIKNDNNIIVESEYNNYLCEFDLLVASMILIKYIGDLLNIDPSNPTNFFSGEKLYEYSGNL